MKVEWVHPSWRDLVIESLANDSTARRHFLRRSETHGIVLALSTGGGGRGERMLPLIRSDRDWDALTDRLFEAVTELELPDLIAVLSALAEAIDELAAGSAVNEATATARTVLARVTAVWDRAHKPIPPDAVYAWLALGRRLEPRPEPPDLSATWVEALPARAPEVDDRVGVERFAEWLALCQVVWDYDARLRGRFGVNIEQTHMMVSFLTRVEQARLAGEPAIVDAVPGTLDAIAEAAPELRGYARQIAGTLQRAAVMAAPTRLAPEPEPTYYRGETFDVRRVMLDL